MQQFQGQDELHRDITAFVLTPAVMLSIVRKAELFWQLWLGVEVN